MFDASGNLVDTVWFRQLKPLRLHSPQRRRSLRRRESGTENERIAIDLNQVPATVQALIFTVNSFSGEETGIPNAFCRLVDETNDSEIARFDLSLKVASIPA